MFQLTAARRRLAVLFPCHLQHQVVSTHSRPEAAGRRGADLRQLHGVSTHSRPEAAGSDTEYLESILIGFNSQPPGGGWAALPKVAAKIAPFQLTAARRRLDGSRNTG